MTSILPLNKSVKAGAAGYLHRDIKPPNIFICNDGSPILIDFGSARMKATVNKELTAIVSPGFSPLEQYHSHGRQGPRTDLFALAGVMYWLVTGKKPIEAAARVGTDPMPPLADIGDSKYYTRHFLSAIDWALKVPETERPQSVPEWRTTLADVNAVDILLDAPSSAARPAPPGATSLTQMPTGVVFDRDLLKRIQTELARHVGPIAASMIKRAATKSLTVPDLVAMLAPDIADSTARRNRARRAYRCSGKCIGKARNESKLYLLVSDEITDKVQRRNFVRMAIALSGKN